MTLDLDSTTTFVINNRRWHSERTVEDFELQSTCNPNHSLYINMIFDDLRERVMRERESESSRRERRETRDERDERESQAILRIEGKSETVTASNNW